MLALWPKDWLWWCRWGWLIPSQLSWCYTSWVWLRIVFEWCHSFQVELEICIGYSSLRLWSRTTCHLSPLFDHDCLLLIWTWRDHSLKGILKILFMLNEPVLVDWLHRVHYATWCTLSYQDLVLLSEHFLKSFIFFKAIFRCVYAWVVSIWINLFLNHIDCTIEEDLLHNDQGLPSYSFLFMCRNDVTLNGHSSSFRRAVSFWCKLPLQVWDRVEGRLLV